MGLRQLAKTCVSTSTCTMSCVSSPGLRRYIKMSVKMSSWVVTLILHKRRVVPFQGHAAPKNTNFVYCQKSVLLVFMIAAQIETSRATSARSNTAKGKKRVDNSTLLTEPRVRLVGVDEGRGPCQGCGRRLVLERGTKSLSDGLSKAACDESRW